MRSHRRRLSFLPLAIAALLLVAFAPASWADDEGDEIPFAEANVFFELNNTDGDLGIHALIDGEPWKRLEIENPDERSLLDIRVRSKLRRQGMTELAFESAEPTFDELSPEEFFDRFPEGEYEVEGATLDGAEMESTAIVTHVMPAPPSITVNGEDLPEDCDEGPVPEVSEPLTIAWEEVEESHPDLGRTGELIEVDSYELVVEGEDVCFGFDLPPDITEVTLPAGLVSSGEELKVEVLVTEESGNRTATESCFVVK